MQKISNNKISILLEIFFFIFTISCQNENNYKFDKTPFNKPHLQDQVGELKKININNYKKGLESTFGIDHTIDQKENFDIIDKGIKPNNKKNIEITQQKKIFELVYYQPGYIQTNTKNGIFKFLKTKYKDNLILADKRNEDLTYERITKYFITEEEIKKKIILKIKKYIEKNADFLIEVDLKLVGYSTGGVVLIQNDAYKIMNLLNKELKNEYKNIKCKIFLIDAPIRGMESNLLKLINYPDTKIIEHLKDKKLSQELLNKNLNALDKISQNNISIYFSASTLYFVSNFLTTLNNLGILYTFLKEEFIEMLPADLKNIDLKILLENLDGSDGVVHQKNAIIMNEEIKKYKKLNIRQLTYTNYLHYHDPDIENIIQNIKNFNLNHLEKPNFITDTEFTKYKKHINKDLKIIKKTLPENVSIEQIIPKIISNPNFELLKTFEKVKSDPIRINIYEFLSF